MFWGILIGLQSLVFSLPKDQLDSELRLIDQSAEQISRARELLEAELEERNIAFRKEETRFSFEESLQNLETAEQQLLALQTDKEVELSIRRTQALSEILKLYLKPEDGLESFMVGLAPIRFPVSEESRGSLQSGFQVLVEEFEFLSWSDRNKENLDFNDRNSYREQFDILLGDFRRALRDFKLEDERISNLRKWADTTYFRVIEHGELEAIYRIDSNQ